MSFRPNLLSAIFVFGLFIGVGIFMGGTFPGYSYPESRTTVDDGVGSSTTTSTFQVALWNTQQIIGAWVLYLMFVSALTIGVYRL